MKRIVATVITALAMTVPLYGCSAMRSGLVEFERPETTAYSADAYAEAENTVRRLMAATGLQEGPSLDPDFFRKHLDMDSFDELVRRTEQGIRATQDKAGMTTAEAALWSDIIARAELDQYTTEDVMGRLDDMLRILGEMADEAGRTMEGYLSQRGMNIADTRKFMEEQAEKYREVPDPKNVSLPSLTDSGWALPDVTLPEAWTIPTPTPGAGSDGGDSLSASAGQVPGVRDAGSGTSSANMRH